MTDLEIENLPDLRDPIAVIAFAGWNDASSAATNAARFVAQRLNARRFATVSADAFFDFRAVRPSVRIRPNGQREISWPVLEFLWARNPRAPHDIIVAVGTEPNLRWNHFARTVAALLRDLRTSLIITVGALLADAPHTRPVRVTGSAPDAEMAARLNLAVSRYEGPTGIVGVLNDALRRSGIPAASLWANCPHYVSTNQNPPATAALVTRLSPLIGVTFDLTELERAGERFLREVNTAVAGNPDVAAYIKRLEAAADSGDLEAAPELPAASEDLFRDIERFLRGESPPGDSSI